MVDEVGYDAIVVGGGFAGLTAALWLGRFRRRTLVLSAGPSRNANACAAHGYPGYDGADPAELLAKLTQEVDQYPSVARKGGHVGTAVKEGDTFCVTVGERVYTSRRILVATGIEDVAPDLPDFDSFAVTRRVRRCTIRLCTSRRRRSGIPGTCRWTSDGDRRHVAGAAHDARDRA